MEQHITLHLGQSTKKQYYNIKFKFKFMKFQVWEYTFKFNQAELLIIEQVSG